MWTFAIKQKMKAAILLFIALVAVMLTNMREQRTVQQISTKVTSIYEDRLVVAQYILELTQQMEGIISTLEKKDENTIININEYLRSVASINTLYGNTLLTKVETLAFEDFKKLCATIAINNQLDDHNTTVGIAKNAARILQTLSLIQVDEGKQQLDDVLSMITVSNVISYLELGLLVIIALLIQMLVFSSKTMVNVKRPSHERLN